MEVAQQNGSFLPTLLVKLEQGILNNVALSEEEEKRNIWLCKAQGSLGGDGRREMKPWENRNPEFLLRLFKGIFSSSAEFYKDDVSFFPHVL